MSGITIRGTEMTNTGHATLSDFRVAIHGLRNGVDSWKTLSESPDATEAQKDGYARLTCDYVDSIRELFANRHGASFPTFEYDNPIVNDENDTPESDESNHATESEINAAIALGEAVSASLTTVTMDIVNDTETVEVTPEALESAIATVAEKVTTKKVKATK